MSTTKAAKASTQTGANGGSSEQVSIPAPSIGVAAFLIRGTTPFVQHKFSEKAKLQMAQTQQAGSQARKGKIRVARDFDADYEAAMYRMPDGTNGIPCAAFRAGMISACRLVGFTMTRAKLSLFVEADGYDGTNGLVRFSSGAPHPTGPMPARNDNGSVDLRNRPMWDPGWEAIVRIRYDRSQFSLTDVAHLLARVGMQVGVGEGRPDSKNSAGMGWGLFELVKE